MSLDLKSLESAIKQLEEALTLYDRASAEGDLLLQKHMRTAAIKSFEFTYEITFKMIRRYLEKISASPEAVGDMTFSSVIREAFGRDLVCSDISVWRKYRKNHGITSHTYNEDKAQKVFDGIDDFLQDMRYTLAQLQARNKSLE